MRKSWWRAQSELDDKQRDVITLPKDGRYLLTGPPGSGKTNLLLLRAKYLSASGVPDVLFLTVGRTLQEFIATGIGDRGLIKPDQIQTLRSWIMRHLGEHSSQFMRDPPSGDYQTTKTLYANELQRVNKRLSPLYGAILIDEVQDLSEQELGSIARLTTRLMVAGDDRQSIYSGGEGIAAAEGLGLKRIDLEFHYRIGQRICEAADAVFPPPDGVKPLIQTCNYDERVFASSKRLVAAKDFEAQVEAALVEIRVQLKAYPGEAIGIFVPRDEQVGAVRGMLQGTDIAELCAYHERGRESARDFPEDKRVFVMTIHSAKGTEFRAIHVLGAEALRGRMGDRRVVFTAFTRAKTSLRVYHTGAIRPYLKGAFVEASTPTLDELFGDA